jgi:pre-mRNA-splicing factor SYF1
MVFDAYTQFEESMLAAKMEILEVSDDEREEEKEQEALDNGRTEIEVSDGVLAAEDPKRKTQKVDQKTALEKWEREILSGFWLNDENDIDLRLARLEDLMNRRPELVSSVLLRQNPHNVHEWHKRVKLFVDNPARQILTFTEAVRTVDPFKAVGKPHTLWVSFARLYEAHDDLVNARVIFDKAVQVGYKAVDDLASVWCEWAEMELRHKNFKGALKLMARATAEPSAAVKRIG